MVINFDTNRPLVGHQPLLDLLTAVEAAHATDENYWIEFKANLNPTDKAGRSALAKTIVGFANRDQNIATKTLGGYGVVLVGLEPGNVVGAPVIDPADLTNAVNALIAAPRPHWEPIYLTYKTQQVLVILISPPKAGDHIACIGKTAPGIDDGTIYVRNVGTTAPATHADIRRLEQRLLGTTPTIKDLTVAVHGQAARVKVDPARLDAWVQAEEGRLLAPLQPAPPKKTTGIKAFNTLDAGKTLAEVNEKIGLTLAQTINQYMTTHKEDRTEDEYRKQVTAYTTRARAALDKTFLDVRQANATKVVFSMTNDSNRNFEDVVVRLHIEGDVFGYGYEPDEFDFNSHMPKPPRIWGPWTETRDPLHGLLGNLGGISHPITIPNFNGASLRPRPTITNDGSVNITSVPVHMRPGQTETLVTVWLVANEDVADTAHVTWQATATNVDGILEGELELPIANPAVDVTDQVAPSND